MTDAFGREIKDSIDDLKAALLRDVTPSTKQNTKAGDDNTEQLKKLNEKLDNIIGGSFNKELKAIAKLIERVADCCKEIGKSRGEKSNKEINREANAYAKAVARVMGPRVGGDISSEMKKAFKDTKPVMADVTDKAMNFGLVLERSQRRFSVAFKMIGKQLQTDFGGIAAAIRDRMSKLNPFKLFEKDGEKSNTRIGRMWQTTTKTVRESWKGLTTTVSGYWNAAVNTVSGYWQAGVDTISGYWNNAVNTVSGWWQQGVKKVSDLFSSAVTKITNSWIGRAVGSISQAIGNVTGWISKKSSQYLGPLAKAASNTVKDLLKLGKGAEETAVKTAARKTDDLTGDPTKKVMEGEGDPVGPGKKKGAKGKVMKMDFNDDNLCRCICRCMAKLQGVTIKEGKSRRKEARDASSTASRSAGLLRSMAAGATGIRKTLDSRDPRDAMIREEQMQEKLEKRRQAWSQRGQSVRSTIVGVTQGIGQMLASENPLRAMAEKFTQFASKAAGWMVSKPLELLGGILEKQEIFGFNLAALGGPLKFLGEAFGGLAEGLTSLVLQPIAEEVGNFQEEMQAMYTIRGATGAVTAGTGMTRAAQGVQDYVDGINIAAKKEEMLKRTAEEITETGQKLATIQKQHIKNLRMGIREEDKFNKTSNIGLRAGAQIGANAEQTADMFAEWKISLGASNIQMGQMDRGLLSIARTTGVFGDNLIRAAKASQQFMEYMRLSGTFTAKAGNNIIGIMAEAEKRGVGKGAGNIMQVLQGSLLGEQGDEKSKRLAIVASKGSERVRSRLMSGTMMQDRGAQKIFAENLGSELNTLAKQRFGKSFDELSIEEKGWLSNLTRELFGMGAEEMDQVIKTFQERAKGFNDRMNDLNNGAKKGMTAIEIANQKEQLIYDTGAEVIEDFTRALKESGGDVATAFGKVAGEADNAEFLKATGTSSINDVLKKQAEQLKARATREGLTSEVAAAGIDDAAINKAMDDLAKGDRKGYDELIGRMTALEGKTREQMRQNADPATKMLMLMFKMEGYLKIMARQAMSELAPMASGAAAAMDDVLDRAAKEFAKGTPEGREAAVKIVGEALKNLPKEITKMNKEVQKIPGATNMQKGAATLMDLFGGEGTLIGEFIGGIGAMIEKYAKRIAEAIEGIEKKIGEFIDKINEHLDGLKMALNIVLGVLVAGGLIVAISALGGAFGTLMGLLAGPAGLVALFAALGAAGYYLHGKIRENDKAIQEQGKKFGEQREGIVDEAAKKRQDLLKGDMSDEAVKAEKKAAEDRKKAADAANELLDSNVLKAQRGVEALGKLTGIGYGEGSTETSRNAAWAVEARKREADKSSKLADAAGELAKIQDPAERAREKEKKLREIYNDNLSVANISLAKNTKDAIKALEEARTKALNELDELRKQDEKRWKLGRGWERLTSGQTEEERKSGELLNKFQEAERALNAKKKELEEQEAAIKATGAARGAYIKEKAFPVMVASALKGEQLDKLGGMDKTIKSLQDYAKGESFLKTDDSKLNTLQKAQKAAAAEALKQLTDAGVDIGAYTKLVNDEFGKLGDLATVSGLTFKNKIMEVQKKMKMTPDQIKKFDEAAVAAKKIWDDSKSTRSLDRAIKERTYETKSGKILKTASLGEAQNKAKAMGEEIIDNADWQKALIEKGATEITGKTAKGADIYGKDYSKYAEKVSETIKPEDVQKYDLTQKLMGEKDKFKQQQMFAELNKTLLQNIDVDKMSWADYNNAITQLATLRKAGKMLNIDKEAPEIWQNTATDMNVLKDAATNPGSIYTHDVYLEKLLTGMGENLSKLPENMTTGVEKNLLARPGMVDMQPKTMEWKPGMGGKMQTMEWKPGGMAPKYSQIEDMMGPPLPDVKALRKEAPPSVSPSLPGVNKDVEAEIRRKQAEMQNENGVDMAKTENNTGSTASNTAAMVRLLGRLGRLLLKKNRNDGNLGAGADVTEDPFFEEVLSTEWPNARIGRTVGLEFDFTDIS